LLGAGKEAYQKARVYPVTLVSDVPFQLSLSRMLLATRLGCKNYVFKKQCTATIRNYWVAVHCIRITCATESSAFNAGQKQFWKIAPSV